METKKWFKSKTIMGILIALIGFVTTKLGMPDFQLPQNADAQQIIDAIAAVKSGGKDTQMLMGQILTILGLAVGIYGRVKAETKIS